MRTSNLVGDIFTDGMSAPVTPASAVTQTPMLNPDAKAMLDEIIKAQLKQQKKRIKKEIEREMEERLDKKDAKIKKLKKEVKGKKGKKGKKNKKSKGSGFSKTTQKFIDVSIEKGLPMLFESYFEKGRKKGGGRNE